MSGTQNKANFSEDIKKLTFLRNRPIDLPFGDPTGIDWYDKQNQTCTVNSDCRHSLTCMKSGRELEGSCAPTMRWPQDTTWGVVPGTFMKTPIDFDSGCIKGIGGKDGDYGGRILTQSKQKEMHNTRQQIMQQGKDCCNPNPYRDGFDNPMTWTAASDWKRGYEDVRKMVRMIMRANEIRLYNMVKIGLFDPFIPKINGKFLLTKVSETVMVQNQATGRFLYSDTAPTKREQLLYLYTWRQRLLYFRDYYKHSKDIFQQLFHQITMVKDDLCQNCNDCTAPLYPETDQNASWIDWLNFVPGFNDRFLAGSWNDYDWWSLPNNNDSFASRVSKKVATYLRNYLW